MGVVNTTSGQSSHVVHVHRVPRLLATPMDKLLNLDNVVHVRSVVGDDTLSLQFQLKGREYRLLRDKQEPVSKALKRIVTTLSKDGKGKKKKKNTGAPTEAIGHVSLEVHIYCNELEGGGEISPETTNQEAWVGGNTLAVNDTRFAIAVNAPTVKHLQLPGCIMTTCAAVPLVELEFTEVEQCRWTWRRCDSGVELPVVFPEASSNARATATSSETQSLSPACRKSLSACPVISTSFVYWTTEEDSGHCLTLECTPCNNSGEEGQVVAVASKNAVSKFQNLPMAERHLFTPSHLAEPDQFRVVSYNILANVYASSDRAKQVLYPYCNAHALDQEYRQCVLAREILGYRADIVALQEVGAKFFLQFLSPALHHWGYEGCFHTKAGKTREGEAIFFNRSKFSLVSNETVILRDFAQESPNCRHLLSLHPLVLSNLLKRHNILQTVLLRSTECPNRYVLVANTHLYFHPLGDHVRLLQVEICVRYLETTLEVYRQRIGKDGRIAVIFCGDFNSCPCTAAYNYILSASVSRSHPDWQLYSMTEVPQCSCNHRALNVIHEDDKHWTEEQVVTRTREESSAGLDLKHGLHFTNSCGTKYSTNVTLGWTGVIDYIFIDSDNMRTQRVVPFPPAEQLTEHVALPSVNFPSDHVALVTDLTWHTE